MTVGILCLEVIFILLPQAVNGGVKVGHRGGAKVGEERTKLLAPRRDLQIIEDHNMSPEEYRERDQSALTPEMIGELVIQLREETLRQALGDECIE